jgi:hypothetical protein
MRFRKLRIAWSVFCGVTCVLLIALWVQSYVSAFYRASDFDSKPTDTYPVIFGRFARCGKSAYAGIK